MANGSDDALGRIANSLESIALAFLGPREAFIEINGEQLKNVIEDVLEIWEDVKTGLQPSTSALGTSSTLAAPGLGGQGAFFTGVGGVFGGGVFQTGGVFIPFDPRVEARSRLIKLLPPVEAEIRFLCPLRIALKDTDDEVISPLCTSLSDTAVNFDPDNAQEVQDIYREVARRTTEVAVQTREGLTGVKDFLTQFNISFDGEFAPANDALTALGGDKVRDALKIEEIPVEPISADSGEKAPPKTTSGASKPKKG